MDIKLVCIKYAGLSVTVGRVYDGVITPKINDVQKCIVTANDNERRVYDLDQFMPLGEWREKRINEILDEK